MKKLVIVALFMVALMAVATALPSNSDAFFGKRAGGCGCSSWGYPAYGYSWGGYWPASYGWYGGYGYSRGWRSGGYGGVGYGWPGYAAVGIGW